jgi:GDP-L-fucose synthase
MKKIFIAEHDSMVGFALKKKLSKKYKIFTADKSKLDLLNYEQTLKYFKRNRFDQVYFCTAKEGGIYANLKYPADFIYKNLQIQNNCIISCYKSKVKKLLFLGSSCIYPKNSKSPIKENFLLNGKLEKSSESYALAKIAGIKMCESFNNQYGTDYRVVIPTNLYGPNDNFDKLNSHVLIALIRKIYNAKINNKKKIIIWGNGKPKREFLHVDDFAKACVKIMNFSKKKYLNLVTKQHQFINIGFGQDITINELTKLISRVLKYKVKILFDKSKLNGTYRKLIDSSKIKSTGWKPKISLKDGILSTINSLDKKSFKD